MDKKVFRNMSYGVYLVTTMDGNRPTGCVANSIMQITSEPSVVAVSMNHDNYTKECIVKHGRLAVTIMAEDTAPALIGVFGFQSGKNADKFEDVAYDMHAEVPVPAAGCGWYAGEVIGSFETETHTVFFVKVTEGETRPGTPMTYAYYHNVVKGKSPKNAPTYQPEEPEKTEATWVCSICGYEYKGDVPFEELPEDYLCPICKQPKSKFEQR